MLINPCQSARRGATVVESAFVYPVLLFLMIALVVGSMGVFRYQEVAFLAREGARYGSTHGAQYRSDAGQSVGTDTDWVTDIKTNSINGKIAHLDPSKLTITISWPNVVNQPTKKDNWPGSSVTVKITYSWIPEKWLLGPYTLTSTSTMPITN